MKRRSTYEAPRWDQTARRSGLLLCLFHLHKWDRLTVFSILGFQCLYKCCGRCGVMRQAVS